MKVFDREFSNKFDGVYNTALQSCESVQFRPITQHPNPNLRRVKGSRTTEQKNGNRIVVIYLQESLEDEEMEKVAVHELCHEIIRNEGFDFKFRVNTSVLKEKMKERLQREINEEELLSKKEVLDEVFTYTYNMFVHIPVNLYIKRYGYDVKQQTRPILKKIKQRIIQLRSTDKDRLFQEALVYLQEKYCSEYSCETMNFARLENLYKKLKPAVLNMAKEIMKYIPDVNLLEPRGCYIAIRSLRDAYGQILRIPDFSSLIELLNPWTKKVE